MRSVGQVAAVGLAAVFAACGGAERGPEPAPRPAPAAVDSLHARFERAYFKIACMANAGRDPESSFTPLRTPGDYLDGLVADKSPRLAKALEILREHGFGTVVDFRVVETRLRGDGEWWTSRIDARFVDELKACKAP